jgi:hypothetical protein
MIKERWTFVLIAEPFVRVAWVGAELAVGNIHEGLRLGSVWSIHE